MSELERRCITLHNYTQLFHVEKKNTFTITFTFFVKVAQKSIFEAQCGGIIPLPLYWKSGRIAREQVASLVAVYVTIWSDKEVGLSSECLQALQGNTNKQWFLLSNICRAMRSSSGRRDARRIQFLLYCSLFLNTRPYIECLEKLPPDGSWWAGLTAARTSAWMKGIQ